MAYSDYGSYIWKNGKNITKKCADKSFYFINNQWIDYEKIPEEYNEKIIENAKSIGGHAILIFEDFAIGFYKIYDPIIYFSTETVEEIKFSEFGEYTNGKLNLEINKMYLNTNENIVKFEIKYKGDCYCVICGSSVGNGFDSNKTSKFILKHIVFNNKKETMNYYFNSKIIDDTTIEDVFNKLERLDDINFYKYMRWQYGIKLFLKDFILLKWNLLSYHWKTIVEETNKIKVLK